jgi:hypothetical protein
MKDQKGPIKLIYSSIGVSGDSIGGHNTNSEI